MAVVTTALRRALPRVGGALVVLFTVATLAFIALQFIPGDPAEAALGGPGSQASAAALEAARAEFGLDRPILVQYLDFLRRLVIIDLGVSYSQRIPVSQVLANAIGPTLTLAGMALVLAWILALVSVYVASGPSRVGRAIAGAIDLVAAAMPNFWLASMLVLLFASMLGWFPPVSTNNFRGIVLPALSLALPTAGFIAQVCRAGIEDARRAFTRDLRSSRLPHHRAHRHPYRARFRHIHRRLGRGQYVTHAHTTALRLRPVH